MIYQKEFGKKNLLTYKFGNKYIYSYYDPVTEAKRYLSSIKINSKVAITCCGLDYINRLLLENGVEEVLSFDPIGFEILDNSPKIKRFKDTDSLELYIKKNKIDSPQLFIWKELVETDPNLFLAHLKKIKEFIQKETFSNRAASHFGFLESKNILKNINKLKEIKILKKTNNTITNPALIVSSGFSLKENIDFVKDVLDYVYIFSLPSALPYLDFKGIRPDFVMAVDPGYGTFYHLAKYQKGTDLITTLNVTPSVFNIDNYNTLFFSYDNYLEKIIYDDYDIVNSCAEGSVIFNLLRVVKEIGFDTAILVGQDFGFKENRGHIYEGSFEREFIARSNYLRPLEHLIKDGECKKDLTYIEDGKKKIKSDYSLQIYYNHFINNDFGLEILLPSKSYNRLNDKFKIIDARYIAKKYPKIKNRGESRNKIYRVKEILKSEVIDIDKKRDELFKKLKNILESGEKDNDNNQLKLLNVANDKEIKEKQIKKIKTIAQSMNLKN